LVIRLFFTVYFSLFTFHCLTACGVDINENLGKIRRVQIISIVADPPETTPGSEVTLTAAAVDPENWGTGEDQMVYSWVFFYLDPDDPLDLTVDPMSLNLSDLVDFLAICPQTSGCELELGAGNPWTFTLPDRSPEAVTAYSVFLMVADSVSTLARLMQGEEVTGKFDLAVKGIKVSEGEELNHNPVIDAVTASPAEYNEFTAGFRVDPEEKILLTARAFDLDVGDELAYRWWILSGRLEDDNLEQVEWKSPEQPGRYPVFLVVRDKVNNEPIGGQAAAEITIEVIEPMPGPPAP
jgi:hypothetical protein